MTYKEASFKSRAGNQETEIHYSDWGEKNARPIICVHGLTGNGHDFDYLAPTLVEDGYRVIAVDLVGRGRSDFLRDPMLYNYEQYVTDLYELLQHLGFKEVDWLGVSLGGLLGMRIAAEKDTPIRRMILVDIGPEVPKSALDFIYEVIKVPYVFDTVRDIELRMRQTRGLTWGPVTDEQWHHMAEHSARGLTDGGLSYAYDPQIARVFETEPIGALDMWACWDAISGPLLVIQGGMSVLLTQDILP